MKRFRSLVLLLVFSPLIWCNQAFSATYEFSFLANPAADGGSPPDQSIDVTYVVRFDSTKFSTYNLANLNSTSHWISRDITLEMRFNGQSAYLNDALDPAAATLTVQKDPSWGPGSPLYEGGFIEIYPTKSEFLDIDFHPWSSFVLNNHLPFTPFVYGQLDVYDDQVSFSDFHELWTVGSNASLEQYRVPSVPEPTELSMLMVGLLVCSFVIRSKRKVVRES